MKEYLLNLWEKIKKSSVKCKILLSLLIVLYIGIICVSTIQLDVDATTPGSITNVSHVINIESENKTGNIYTVSVFTKSKVSVMQYLLMSLDKNTEITSFKVQARIDNSKTLNKDGTPLPDIINDSSVEVHIVNKIVSNDITLYEAGDMTEITLPDSPTEEDLAKLDSITVKNDTVKTLIKNIEDINFVNVII